MTDHLVSHQGRVIRCERDQIVRCDECGEECYTTVVDMGIGSFEYWGAVGFDSQPVQVSSCCEAGFTCEDAS